MLKSKIFCIKYQENSEKVKAIYKHKQEALFLEIFQENNLKMINLILQKENKCVRRLCVL